MSKNILVHPAVFVNYFLCRKWTFRVQLSLETFKTRAGVNTRKATTDEYCLTIKYPNSVYLTKRRTRVGSVEKEKKVTEGRSV